MKISYNWLKKFVDINVSTEELDNTLTMLGLEVESVTNLGEKYNNFIVAYVEGKEKHPDADKLSVCRVNTGNEMLQVVCGATNVGVGQKIVLGLNGAIVPNGGFKLEKRKIRGIESNGMICSKSELDLGQDHSGIWVVEESLPDSGVKAGTKLAELIGFNDVILEIGVTPNKAECLSHYGIARELAAYYDLELKPLVTDFDKIVSVDSNKQITDYINVEIEDTVNCLRYYSTMVVGAKVKKSPEWLSNLLLSLDIRPINVIVDITNYILMEVGQPLHSFDYHQIKSKTIRVKSGFKNTSFTTLDSKRRELSDDMLMICDDNTPVAIAGVMGGENSEITDLTEDVFIESAYFNPSSVRKTSKKLSLQTDASYRFERGTDVEITEYAAKKAAEMLCLLAEASLVSGVIDVYPQRADNIEVQLNYSNVKRILGLEIDKKTILPKLEKLGFQISEEGDSNSNSNSDLYKIVVPNFRHDVFSEIDLIEDIARLYNYDNIESNLNSNINFGTSRVPENLLLSNYRFKIRDYLVSNGFNQIYTQNMIDPKTAELTEGISIQILNPLGEDLSFLRKNLSVTTLKVISYNIKQGAISLKLFEIGKSFKLVKENHQIELNNISEDLKLSIALVGNELGKTWLPNHTYDFYDIKGLFQSIVEKFDVQKVDLKINSTNSLFGANSLEIWLRGKVVGHLGQVSKKTLKYFDIEKDVFLLEIDLKTLEKASITQQTFTPIANFPSIERDLAFILNKDYEYAKIKSMILKQGGKLLKTVEAFDVYEGKNIEKGKRSIGFNLVFNSAERTLQEVDIEKNIKDIVTAIEKEFGGVLRDF